MLSLLNCKRIKRTYCNFTSFEITEDKEGGIMLKKENMGLGSDDLNSQNLTGVNEESPIANTPVKVLTASSIIGDKVKNFEGKKIGEINDIMLNLKDGCVEYVVLEFGGFLGVGEKLFAIPFNSLQLDPTEKVFYLDVNKDLLENAPGFDEHHWPQTNSNHWGEVDKYWDNYRERFER